MWTGLRQYLDLVIVMTQKEMKVRYKNSLLGYLWSVAHPLAFAFIFYVAFKVVMRIGMEDYALFLIAGLFPWQWFSNSITAASMSFLSNASIIKKVNFPRNVVVMAGVLQDMIHFLLSVPVIALFLVLYDKTPFLSWTYGIPLLCLIHFTLTYGLALVVSSLNLFFRDLERLNVLLVTLFFYFTPILYPETMVPQEYRVFLDLNPLAPLMISWRNLLFRGVLDPFPLLLCSAYAAAAFLFGYVVYRKLSWRFAEVL